MYYLSRSANNTFPYFTDGNTPCGVFLIQGKSLLVICVYRTCCYIGYTGLPFESEVTAWGITGKEWTEICMLVSCLWNYVIYQCFGKFMMLDELDALKL